MHVHHFKRESFTADDGEIIHVHTVGSGPPLVLLHEWAGDHSLWAPLAERFAHAFSVYQWDARGHGGHASTGREPPVVDRMADDLKQMLEHFNLDAPLVVGHSMGALTIWAHVARYGCDGFGQLCIIDQSPRLLTDEAWSLGIYGRFTAEDNARLTAAMQADFPEAVLGLIGNGKNPRIREAYERNSRGMQRIRERMASMDPEPLITAWKSLGEKDFRPVLSKITVPTLLVYGDESNYYGPETGVYVQGEIPDASLLVYEHADHAPHLNRPEHFIEDLSHFAGVTIRHSAAA